MQGGFIEDLLVSGVPMLALLPIPVLAVACAIALWIGLARRRLVLAVGSIVLAATVGFAAGSLRDLAAVPAAVDVLIAQLPIALAIGALPALVRLVPATVGVVRRRVASMGVDAGLGTPASGRITTAD